MKKYESAKTQIPHNLLKLNSIFSLYFYKLTDQKINVLVF